MKKILVLLTVVMILPFVLAQDNLVCTDTDGGKDYNVAGSVSAGEVLPVRDSCIDESILSEGYCENGNMLSEEYTCPHGCQDGACKLVVGGDGECLDSDGGQDYSVAGIVSFGTTTPTTDICVDSSTLREAYCDNNIVSSVDYACPNGCLNGICQEEVVPPTVCTDSDGGEEYYVQGTTQGLDEAGYEREQTDYCHTPNAITEWYCHEDGQHILSSSRDCPTICQDGACKQEGPTPPITPPPTEGCIDSDEGVNYYVKGTIQGVDEAGAPRKGTDNCQGPAELQEWYCDAEGQYLLSTYFECETRCLNGACEKEGGPTPEHCPTEEGLKAKERGIIAAGGRSFWGVREGCTFVSGSFEQFTPTQPGFLQPTEEPIECPPPDVMNIVRRKCIGLGMRPQLKRVGSCDFVDCIEGPEEEAGLIRGDERFIEYDEISEVPAEAKILAAVLNLEKLKIQFDKLQKELEEIASYYDDEGKPEEAERFHRASTIIQSTQGKITSIKDDLRSRVGSLTIQDVIRVKRDIKYITKVVFKDVLYVILGGEETEEMEYEEAGMMEAGTVNCGRDLQCFEKYLRVCKPVKVVNPDATLHIKGIKGNNCLMHIEGSPQGMTAECKVPDYAFVKLDLSMVEQYCEGPLIEMIRGQPLPQGY